MTGLRALLVTVALAGPFGWQEPGGNAPARKDLPDPPRIEVVAPEALAPQAARLERVDPVRLAAVMRLVGLEDAGPPIPVFLVPEDARVARQTPTWVAAFASGGEVVVFPARSPSYPHESLQELLQHEVAHVLINRAAGGQRVPRWFHEGVALAAERTFSLGDRTNFAIDVAFGGTVQAASLDLLFQSGPGGVARAYRLSGLLVQDLLEVHGPRLPATVLKGMRDGTAFDAAFLASAGMSVDEAVARFWHRRRLWVTWVPWLTSAASLWTLMMLLALAAFVAVRWRRARRRWDEEEDQEPQDQEEDREPRADPPSRLH